MFSLSRRLPLQHTGATTVSDDGWSHRTVSIDIVDEATESSFNVMLSPVCTPLYH